MIEIEKLAEEYVQNLLEKDDEEIDNLFEENLGNLKLTAKQAGTLLGIIKGIGISAFHAGYKANKPKWHMVADGDVPWDNRDVLSDKGDIVYYDNINGFWIDNKASVEVDNVDAWCEIPKFERRFLNER